MVDIDQTSRLTKRVEMHNIWKRFPGVIANKGVSLEFRAGEVHALLGENGAGKSTLMNILAGLYRLDAGEIIVNGHSVDIRSPEHAIELGIGMVHQHFRLVDNMTVAENVYLGWKAAPWHVSRAVLAAELQPTAERLGFSLDPNAEVWQLSVGEQQRAEIIRSIARGAQILILDEPTAVLTPDEAKQLFKAVRNLVQNGQTVVFISHKLDEVLELTDRVTILREGQYIATCDTAECDHRSLAEMMVGRNIEHHRSLAVHTPGKKILEVSSVKANSDRGLPALKDIDLEIYQGEILGVAGVAGNGQTELAEVLTGLRLVESGSIKVAGQDLVGCSSLEFAQAGIGHIPEDRIGTGLFSILSLTHNAILRKYKNHPICNGSRLVWPAAEDYTRKLIALADVRTSGIDVHAGTLSGGNQQKLLVRREIEIASKLLVAVHPTRGLDVGATEEVHRALLEYRDGGNATLLISEDLDELFLVSDRIAVMYEGRILGVFSAQEASFEKIGLLMGGGDRKKEGVNG